VVCTSCGAANNESAKFCIECGAGLELRCPGCGTAYRSGQKFCQECGLALTVGAGSENARARATAPVADRAPAVAVEPELRFVSVLFVDLVGFTRLSEGREAEDVRDLLDRYFFSARTVVERYGGVVEKFIGDAVMAVWGAPVAKEDDGERAVRAALEIVDAVSVFGGELGEPGLQARAGVVTGKVAALENPGEGIVVGDRVNTASRVQSAAEPGAVLVDEVTREVASAAIWFEDAGQHSVKGKLEPLRLWRAVRVVAGVGGRQREGLVEAPFVGRDPELRLVKDLLHATVERRAARLVAITGEAGVGKSRLRREFSNYTDGLADTFLWHLGRCLSHGEGVAYWALAEMVRQRFGIPEDAPSHEVSEKLEHGLLEWLPDAADRVFVSPRLGALLGVAEPGLDRAELFAGWRLFFERVAAHEPVILVFEDMQWADDGLLEFIGQLLDWSTDVPIFILTLARPELAEKREGWPVGRRGATIVPLEPLGEREVRALLEGVVDGLPESAAGRIVERAQGIPLYAIETVRGLADRGILEPREGRLVAAGDLGELEVPASLTALLAARLDALDPAERTVVKTMSVFGGSFARETALALADLAGEQVELALAGLVRRQVLVIRADPLSPDQGQYAFAQGLLRTVAYETLSRRERKQRHLAAADHLTTAFPDAGAEVAEVIATHLLDACQAAGADPDAGELRARTVEALRRAAHRAVTVGAPEVAQRSYLTASEHASEDDRPALLQAAGEMASQAGRSEEAIGLLDAAAGAYASAGRGRESALVAYPIAEALRRLGRVGEATARVTVALDTLEVLNAGEADIGRLNASLSRALVFTGEHERAAAAVEAALVAAEAHELPEVLAEALTNKGLVYDFTSRPQLAALHYTGAIDVAERHELSGPLVRARLNLGNLGVIWDLPHAREQTEAAVAGSRRRGDRHTESQTAGNLMLLELLSGRWDELEALARELLDQDPDRPGAEYLRSPLVALYALRGEPPAAAAALERLAAWKDSDDAELRDIYGWGVVIVRLAEGAPDQALEEGLSTLQSALGTWGPATDAVRGCWPDTLQAALALGRQEDAQRIMSMLTDRPVGHIPPYLRAQLTRGRALVNAVDGPHEAVQTDLETAIDAFGKLGYPYWHAVTQTDLAAWHVDQQQPAAAAPLLEQAVATLTPLRAAPALTRAYGLTQAPTSVAP
jgi:class 3 adenylate cyclase/tetratricopeptide (TPR) repeat protein